MDGIPGMGMLRRLVLVGRFLCCLKRNMMSFVYKNVTSLLKVSLTFQSCQAIPKTGR